jgi:hypothetical protein
MENHERYDANTVRKIMLEFEKEKIKTDRIIKVKKIWKSKKDTTELI